MTTRAVDRDAVRRLMGEDALVAEVLPAAEYEREHIAGAVSLPLGRLAELVRDEPRERPLVVYCYDYQ